MQARFLLGPAGSGKTFRCVQEARACLVASPAGAPLIFLAPKQATFQIERQLLASPDLSGYARLHILSFERLAAFVYEQLNLPMPELLSEEGRVMVLRALLLRHHAELKIFRASARLAGFAVQLSAVLRELQWGQVSAPTLTALAAKVPRAGRLHDKLHDLALLLDAYHAWLAARRGQGRSLDDGNRLLDLAVSTLRESANSGRRLNIEALWLDGFAEMTPQETALLAALMPHCQRATLAFCLDGEPRGEGSWLSPWTVVGRTFAQCREAVAQVIETVPEIEVLPRTVDRSRFAHAPELLELERGWGMGADGIGAGKQVGASAVRVVACPSPELEVAFAAREITRHVQSGGRFRECGILVRSLDGYHDVLRRILSRYDIPFFLDRREAVAHHPLAELTRYALRTVGFDWRQEDWFGALKTGLVGLQDADVDWLENEALKRGWVGGTWHGPLVTNEARLSERLETMRQRLMPAFQRLASGLKPPELCPSGTQLAAAIRRLWSDLQVESQLETWLEGATRLPLSGSTHGTVWTQLNDWLDNLELAFATEALPLGEWLPIIEAGLSGMTVGVIPPALDQVLVGSVDRSRNPDLLNVFVLGVNEGVFPARPVPGLLLNDSDRLEMEAHGITLGTSQRQQMGYERYFGYIAFTRPRKQLVVTWAQSDEDGLQLNSSSFVTAIMRAVPGASEEEFCAPDWSQTVHRIELPRHILGSAGGNGQIPPLAGLPEFASLVQRREQALEAVQASRFSSNVAERVYGCELRSSVSALEDFAACPFRYVAARTLRAEERDEFVVDARQKGSFQHEVLQVFHERIQASRRRWRDVSPSEARQLVREIGNAVAQNFEDGLMLAGEDRRFTTSVLIANLEQLMEILIRWAPQYGFDPAQVEVSFGLEGAQLPAWRIALNHGRVLQLRGRIDRIDLCPAADGSAWAVICDYKSSARQMDPVKIEAGLELQLLSYLAALTRMPQAFEWLGVTRLQPAGVFYVPLRGGTVSSVTRGAAAANAAESARAFEHRGRFDGALLNRFDNRGATKGQQFRFSVRRDGELSKRGNDAMPATVFPGLVAGAEAKLRSFAGRILSGEAGVEPFRLKQRTACDYCAYRAVCRFDPWTMPFRPLGKVGEEEA